MVKVDLATQDVTAQPLPPNCTTLGKWEGGVVTADGSLYCMPMGHKKILKITPPGPPANAAGMGGWAGGLAHD